MHAHHLVARIKPAAVVAADAAARRGKTGTKLQAVIDVDRGIGGGVRVAGLDLHLGVVFELLDLIGGVDQRLGRRRTGLGGQGGAAPAVAEVRLAVGVARRLVGGF